jgi:MoxR-like ATPase
LAIPVLRHRISTNFQAQAEGKNTDDVIRDLLAEVPEPEVSKFTSPAAQRAPTPPPPVAKG